MIFGAEPDVLPALKERAKQAVMNHLVRLAESDGVPATMRAMYVMKAAEARIVLDGGRSAYIEAEAALRGIEPLDMAKMVDVMSQQSQQLELSRMRVGIAVDAATDEVGVIAAIKTLGVALPNQT